MPTEEGPKLRHACSTCCRSFSNKRDLVKHQYMHREKPNLVCLHCNRNFTTESNYRRHINALQNVEKKGYNCGNCGSLFRRLRDLEEHHELKHKDDKVFRCQVCQAEFSWHENLLKHQQVHEVNPHICSVCNHEFIDMTSLLVHRRTHHLPLSAAAELPPHQTTRMVISSQQAETSTEKPFTCHICGRRFKFDFSYQAHLDAHVIPASREMSVDVAGGCEATSHLSMPVYVQMDSEGIIDLPAFNSSSNEDVEIIVEVGNVAPTGAPVLVPIPMIPDKDDRDNATCIKSEMDEGTADNGELLRTSEVLKTEQRRDDSSLTGIDDDHENKRTPGSVGNNDRDSALRKTDESEGPPEIDRMDVIDAEKSFVPAVTSYNLYNSRPKKPTKRKRERVPFQFNCVMTDDKPFVCSTCGEAFRWEISLQVHTKAHTEGKVPGIRKIYNSVGAADKKKAMKCKEKVKSSENTTGEPGIKKSRIVYRRDSSDEEEDVEEEDTFAFGNDPEEKSSSQVVPYHGKEIGQRRLRPDNADDMLLEYLVGDESFISLEESSAENEMEDCLQPEEAVLQNKLKQKHKTLKKNLPDESWRKGKAILRKKQTWKPSKQGPETRTGAMHSDSDEELVCQPAVEPETQSGDLVESLGNCDRACEEHSDFHARPLDQEGVIDVDENEDTKEQSCPPQLMTEQGCLDEVDSAAMVAEGGGVGNEVGLNDDRIAMAVAYASVALPPAEPCPLQNGTIKEEPLVAAEAERRENAMDTEQVQIVNAFVSRPTAFSSSLHCQTDRRADDDAVTGRKSLTLGEGTMSESLEQQQQQSAEIEPHKTSDGLIPLQRAEAEPCTTLAGLTPSLGAETDTRISPSQLGEKESNATAFESKHDDSSVRICVSAENGEHAEDSTGGTHSSSSVSRIAKESDQHCLAKEFSLAPISTAATETKNASSPKKTTLDMIAGSTYSASSEPDQIHVKGETLKSRYPIKQRNLRQLSSLFQSFKTRCFFKKGLTLTKSLIKKRVVIPGNVPMSAQGTITKRNNCGQCGKHFTTERALKRHRMRHRSSLKTVFFKCSYCLKRFSTMASLDRHLISSHVSSLATCETCQKQFTTVDSFALHKQHGCVFSAFERK